MNSRYFLIRVLGVVMLAFSVTACEDFFDPDINTTLSEENNYSDFLTTRSTVNGLYALMQDYMTAYVIGGELRADLLTTTGQANADLQQINNLQWDADNPYLGRLQAFRIISNANDVLLNLNRLIDEGTTYTDELLNMHAEVVTLRAWVYFQLMRTYNQVPYISENHSASDDADAIIDFYSDTSADPVQIEILIESVNEVLPHFQLSKVSNGHFFNLASANALLGEMYLSKDDYANAINALRASVETGDTWRFILDADLQNNRWVNLFKGDESATDDIMTKIIFDVAEKQENELLNAFSAVSPNGYHLKPTVKIQEMITNSHRIAGTFKNSAEVGKYTRSLDDPYISDMPVILFRGGDVHLMLAEAYNRLGHVDIALQLLNNGSDSLFTNFSRGIRGRVGLPPVTITAGNLQDSILVTEALILDEKAREMAFEGKRWFDILRVAQRRDDPEYLVNLMVQKYGLEKEPEIAAFFGNKQNWYVSF
jgi:hypothetical protein